MSNVKGIMILCHIVYCETINSPISNIYIRFGDLYDIIPLLQDPNSQSEYAAARAILL